MATWGSLARLPYFAQFHIKIFQEEPRHHGSEVHYKMHWMQRLCRLLKLENELMPAFTENWPYPCVNMIKLTEALTCEVVI